MNKQDIIEFFDHLAPSWDANMIRNNEVIDQILDNASVTEGKDILDVACGTGVLIPDYLSRNVASVTGVDISNEMIKIAKQKFLEKENQHRTKLHFLCADIEQVDFQRRFDCIIVYNAFPHFPNPVTLIQALEHMLKPNGTLTIAHGMSRDAINGCHKGAASKVSMGLMSANEVAKIFSSEMTIIHEISDERMYQVTGIKSTKN